ncbi:arsenate reductase (thioredoxin) [Lacticaseibacillus nasuensis]|uniref:arsenate reductase (thioredoxin) n=1 Tax=Lacticaseibacillus nasuensis TaxID=944671 RepID=UPI002245F6A5|nr:arsenate reductase (thioredoxin) [Lacticaseibacillus nasuensis]MCX2456122.1 arsenate reductase (thioredoxin) [Lacticaseibacillus nasuensis]
MQIYFLCTGNSCRSQMAEGFARALHPTWRVASAGLEQHGLNPLATQVMAEVGIDISGQTSTLIDPAFLAGCDLVVTLCGDARDRCPVVPGVARLHWPLPDPAQATGDQAARLTVFRQVRDEIRRRVSALA